MQHSSGIYGCCGDSKCLRQHLVDEHAELFAQACGSVASRFDSYSYYQEALAVREQETIPKVGPSIDRRTFHYVTADMSEAATQSLVCTCCARTSVTFNGRTHIAMIPAGQYFDKISPESFRLNWCFEEYMKRYGRTQALRNHPELAETSWTWRRRLEHMRRRTQIILCCPEDVQRKEKHEPSMICASCLIPLCDKCIRTSNLTDDAKVGIPEALTNDNFWGYVTGLLYKYRVRWIEAAAACPVFKLLSLITLKVTRVTY